MPFRKWIVQPVFVGRNPKPPDKLISEYEFENITNGTLVKCLRQLGSILEHADRIFEEIGSECRLVYERADRLSSKLQICQATVSNLNARAVKVPVSDLNVARKKFKRQAPYQTVYDQPSQFFLPSNRPQCVDKLYSKACTTPVSVMCTIDRYRSDGCTSSQLFMVTPVLGGTRRKKKKRLLDIETRKPASFSLAKTEQEIWKPAGSLEEGVVSPSIGDQSKLLDRLPSPEELTLATSLEYPSCVVPVDVTGNSFLRMIRCRRSLIHADFEIKRKKGKNKSKRRHTVCEGDNKELEAALQDITMVNNSCQTEELPESSSLFSFRRSFARRRRATDIARRETVALDGLNLDFTKKDGEGTLQSQDRTNSVKKESQQNKKSGKGSLMSRASKMNPISSLSAAISMAVKMRHSKSSGKQDDGRSSSGNWSASSSTRASIDSDQHHAVVLAVDRNSNLSRSSAGKDSVISDATTATTTTAHQDSARLPEHSAVTGLNEPAKFTSNRRKMLKGNALWDYDHGRESNASTPERTSDCASTPLVMSPYINRRNNPNYYAASTIDDGESSVYSVDTDGYYTSMHTDSGLWNVINSLKNGENPSDLIRGRQRKESQSSVSTIGNGSINSFLSKVVTENDNSSNCSSIKRLKPAPDPPPRLSSFNPSTKDEIAVTNNSPTIQEQSVLFEKDSSPLKNGSASESDYESRDRIRDKTTINSSRYPSLCAVSPETSDDELMEVRPKTTSIVVAEVHREEVQEEDRQSQKNSTPKLIPINSVNDPFVKTVQKSPLIINMYGGHSPTESTFSSSLTQNNNVATSTPKKTDLVSSFASDTPDINKESCRESPSLVQKLLLDLKNIPNQNKDFIISSPPVSPKTVPHNVSKTLIPLKYAQRITVTPIARSESVENAKNQTISIVNTPPQRSKSFLKNPLSNLPFRNTENSSSKPKSPSYISFQSPDSPVSSATSLSSELIRTDSPSPKKAVARVTLDPMGRVIYSSSSLDRNKKEDIQNYGNIKKNEPKYATLPKYQASPLSPSVHPVPSIKEISKNPNSKEENFIQSPCNKEDNKNFPPPQYSPSVFQTSESSSKSQNLLFRPSRGGRFCRTYFPSHIISPVSQQTRNTPPPSPSNKSVSPSTVKFQTQYSPSSSITPQSTNRNSQGYTKIKMPNDTCSTNPIVSYQSSSYRPQVSYSDVPVVQQKREFNSEYQTDYKSPATYHFRPVTSSSETKLDATYAVPSTLSRSSPKNLLKSLSPNTDVTNFAYTKNCSNISPLLSSYSYEQMESNGKLSEFTPPNPPDVIPSSSTPPSTLDITARTVRNEGGNLNREAKLSGDSSNLKSLSSSELFAIIHNSKKKHNIKSDSEKSLSPLSSRSSSPAISSTPSPMKTAKIETGVLTRQNKDYNVTSSPKTMDSSRTTDRLGRSRPTSMHDFKMLLLQTRIGGTESTTRPSAAELLNVSPVRNSGQLSPSTLPRVSPNSSLSKMQHSPIYTGSSMGHGTVPVKRITRTRSPYLTRYDSTYPPIWEDCSEDLEAADENQNTVGSFLCSPSKIMPNKEMYTTKMNYGKSVLDNEKPNTQATSTWV